MYLNIKRRGIMANQKSDAKKDTVKNVNAAATAVAAAKKTEAPEAVAKSESVKDKVVKKVESAKKPGRRAKKEKTETVKAAKKQAAKKAAERVQEVIFEFGEKQVNANDVVKQIEDAYKAEGHQIGRIKDLKVYVNAADSRAYYVINGNSEGKSVEI
jgi:hypothetical protein